MPPRTTGLNYPTFSLPSLTQTAGTAIASLVIPFPGGGPAPLMYSADVNFRPNWNRPGGFAHIEELTYTTTTTAHVVYLMRPLNWTTFSAAVPKATTAITLSTDPGKYSTGYHYATPGGAVPVAADDTLVTGDYVCYQLADGTWQVDTIASGTFAGANLVLTTGTPNVTSGVIAANSPLFYFGIFSDTDPATGLANWNTTTVAATRNTLLADTLVGSFATLHAGDPVLFYSGNATNAGTLNVLSGFWDRK